jgi:lipopolysaccharide transport system ATP-binding protein
MPVPAIVARNLGKSYRIYRQPQDRLKQMLLWRFGRRYGEDFWALRGVDFEVAPGERFGVIGKTGSGKSTLLEMIAGTLTPTEGEVQISGRVAALLELGSGFNPDFSGRENVYMSGTILGLSREQIDQRFDQIAAFADIGDFLEQPVKLYSSGMFVRLAFAVGTSVDADVLLIDEALAVGDIFFRQKCYRRLEALRERGVTVVLVTHGMSEVEEFCDRALLLDRGAMQFVGRAVEAVKRYYLLSDRDRVVPAVDPIPSDPEPAPVEPLTDWPASAALTVLPAAAQVQDGAARCTIVGLSDQEGRPCRAFEQGQPAVFWAEFELLRDVDVPTVGVAIHNDRGTIVHGKSTLESSDTVPVRLSGGTILRVRQEITLNIAVGEYSFEFGLGLVDRRTYDRRGVLSHQEVDAQIVRLCQVPVAGQFSVRLRTPRPPAQLLHHGIADLPGRFSIVALRPDTIAVEERA